MSDQEFRAKVLDLRNAQKLYFKTRDQDALALAKQLEREVDRALVETGRPGPFPKEE